MKEILAIIRMNKMTATKKNLVEAGFKSLTAMKVMGRGRSLKELDLLSQVEDKQQRDMLLESLLKGGRLIPKRLLMLVVPDADVPKVVQTIIAANKAGNKGDGKIFVLPVMKAYRVRTGEQGAAAI